MSTSCALAAVVNPETRADFERVSKAIGEFTFVSKTNDIILFTGSRPDGSRLIISVVVGDAIAELNVKYSVTMNEDEINYEYEEIELVNVRCKDKVLPGEGIVVLAGSVITFAIDGIIPNVVNTIVSQLNKSFVTLIDSKCGDSISRDRIYSSNSATVELLRRRYLGIERTILPTTALKIVPEIKDCDAYLFTEFRSKHFIGRFHVERCYIDDINLLFIIPMRRTKSSSDEEVEPRYTFEPVSRDRARLFLTTLEGKDWAEKLSRSFSYTLQRLVEVGTEVI